MTRHIMHHRMARTRHRAGGFSLLELTIALVILGVVGVLLARWVGMEAEDRAQLEQRSLLQRADDAVTAFAAINGRLPCPAADATGHEDCGLDVGLLAYRSIGLPDTRSGLIRYGVYRHADAAADADLAVLRDRNRPLQVLSNTPGAIIGDTLALPTCSLLGGAGGGADCTSLPQLHLNGLDLCTGLRNAMLAPLDTSRVHTLRERSTAAAGNVAYALTSSAPGQAAAIHTGSSVAFQSPRQPSSDTYADKVIAVGLDQMWTRLNCGDALSAATFVQANAAAAGALNVPAMDDYGEQLEIMVDLAEAGHLSGTAGVLAAVAQTAYALGGVFDTVGETLDTYGAWNWRINLSIVGVGSAVGAVIAASVAAGLADAYWEEAKDIRSAFKGQYPDDARTLVNALDSELFRADMVGLYPDPAATDVARNFNAPVLH